MRKLDLRVQRTYKLLSGALLGLLAEKPYESITVLEICERSMVRPATFYKHFGDKNELFTFVVKEKQREFQERASGNSPDTSEHAETESYYASVIDQTLGFFEENRVLVAQALGSKSLPVLNDLLAKQIKSKVCAELQERQNEGETLPGNPQLMAVVFSGALLAVARWWVKNDYRTPRKQLAQQCLTLLHME